MIKQEVLYGQTIEIQLPYYNQPSNGVINGKIKDTDAYVVELSEPYPMPTRVRIPNRNLPLAWGHFSGKECETIILKEEIIEILKY